MCCSEGEEEGNIFWVLVFGLGFLDLGGTEMFEFIDKSEEEVVGKTGKGSTISCNCYYLKKKKGLSVGRKYFELFPLVGLPVPVCS